MSASNETFDYSESDFKYTVTDFKIDPIDDTSTENQTFYKSRSSVNGSGSIEKVKRVRSGPPHMWKEEETIGLLDAVRDLVVYNSYEFEKPTAQVFYAKVKEKCERLMPIDWSVMKSKMRHLKLKYNETINRNESNEPRRICQHFDYLNEIFGDGRPLTPLANEDDESNYDPIASPRREEEFEEVINIPTVGVFTKSETDLKQTSPSYYSLNQRWTAKQTVYLLETVREAVTIDPDTFEKPTSEKFYSNIKRSSPLFRDKDWRMLRMKMRVLREKFLRVVENERDEDTMIRTCPHFKLLKDIFYDKATLMSSHSPKYIQSNSRAQTNKSPSEFSINGNSENDFENENDGDETEQQDIDNVDPSGTSSNDESTIDAETLSISSKMFSNRNFALEHMRLKLQEKKLKLKGERLRQNFELRKMQIKSNERISIERMKLEIESRERLRKYELEQAANS